MKEIRIRRMELENFKCHSHLVLEPNGESIRIVGDNATGKTTVYDALTWLLFGKDSAGNGEKLAEVKPLSRNGEVADHMAVTAVEAELTVDGCSVTFRKTCRELWKNETFEGNSYQYFAEGVPLRKNAYDEKIQNLVPEEIFRVLTSVSRFARDMKWQERRAILFQMAGSPPDDRIMALDPRFAELAADMGQLTLTEEKAKLLHRKKNLTALREDTPGRINECQRSLEALGGTEEFPDPEALAAKRDALAAALAAPDGAALALEQTRLEREHLERRLRELERQEAGAKVMLAGLEGLRESLAGVRIAREECRNDWIGEKAAVFAGGTCPTCGQPMPLDVLKEAAARFETEKQAALRAIEVRAKALEQQENQLEDQIRRGQQEQDRLETLREEKGTVETQLQRIAEKQAVLKAEAPSAAQKEELARVEAQLRLAQAARAREELRQTTRQRIGQLRAQADQAERELAATEHLLELTEEFVRFKARFAEDSVNGMFRLARFRLFRECANGSLEERCDVVYRGVPYLGLNLGARVNIGIDIINTLSEFYGVTVPLFIDNAESVTRLEAYRGQVICLTVRAGEKKVRAEAE